MTGEDPQECAKCNYNMIDTKQAVDHCARKHHGMSVQWKCRKCERGWSNLRSIAAHYRHCTGRPPSPVATTATSHVCDQCERAFTGLAGLQLHRKRKHPAAYNESLPRPTGKNRLLGADELTRLAGVELDLGTSKRINLVCHDHFQHRSVDAIATIRKSKRYKDILKVVVETRSLVDEQEAGEGAQAPEPFINIVEAQLRTRFDELEGDSSPAVRDTLAYTRTSLAEGNATIGLDLLSEEVYRPRKAPDSTSNPRKRGPDFAPTTRSQKRRQLYKQIQSLYQRNRKQAVGVILDGDPIQTVFPDVDRTDEVFRGRFARPSPPDDKVFNLVPGDTMNMGYITSEEISKCRSAMKKKNAPGPDKEVTMDLVLGLELTVLELIFNTWFALGQVPTAFKEARTILLPKSGDATDPNNWRPITICSLIGRLYAKLLAGRLSKCANLSERQKAFVPVDGCGENTALLSSVIAHAHKVKTQVHIAFLDLAKAFDTVPHTSILRALRRKALPEHFIAIVENLYSDANTSISVGDKSTPSIPMTSGVKQGCPLSPVLFNLVLDELIQNIGTIDGLSVGHSKLAILAFADDLVLISGTKDGLASNLRTCEEFFNARSMKLNARKSMTLSLVRAHKRKTMLTDETPHWKVYGEFLPAVKHTEEVKYLGVRYTAGGRPMAKLPKLNDWLQKLKSAPLKPQQRIQIVRSTITSRVIHTLRLCRVHAKLLKNLDRKIRTFIKGVLHLPSGTSTDWFYIPIRMGGLGLQEFMSLIPAAKLKLIDGMKKSQDPTVVDAIRQEHWLKEERWCRAVSSLYGNKEQADRGRVERHISSHTGQTQIGFARLPGQCNWLEGGGKHDRS